MPSNIPEEDIRSARSTMVEGVGVPLRGTFPRLGWGSQRMQKGGVRPVPIELRGCQKIRLNFKMIPEQGKEQQGAGTQRGVSHNKVVRGTYNKAKLQGSGRHIYISQEIAVHSSRTKRQWWQNQWWEGVGWGEFHMPQEETRRVTMVIRRYASITKRNERNSKGYKCWGGVAG